MTTETKRDLAADLVTETKRDLLHDLAICEAATDGPWRRLTKYEQAVVGEGMIDVITACGDDMARVDIEPEDERFIIEAREGWPEAIRRAIEAEAEVMRLNTLLSERYAVIERLEADFAAEEDRRCSMEMSADHWAIEADRLLVENQSLRKDKRLITTCYDGQSARASEYYTEMLRLRAVLERMDDRKNPMMPRSQMAKLAKEAIDYGGETAQENNG